MSRVGARRRTPAELIWGWGTNGDRHPGILERLEKIEQAAAKHGRLLWLILLAIVINTAEGAAGTHIVKAFETASQLLGSLPISLP